MSDAVDQAAARLERAVERLAAVLGRLETAAGAPPGVPPEALAALSARLDDALLRLRGALAEVEGAEAPAEPAGPGLDETTSSGLPDDENRES